MITESSNNYAVHREVLTLTSGQGKKWLDKEKGENRIQERSTNLLVWFGLT